MNNLLLAQLPDEDLSRLQPHLEEVPLEFKQRLYEQDGEVREIYFPTAGLISVITELQDGSMVETATIGYEGVTGLPAALFGGLSTNVVLCQIPGRALRMRTILLDAERRRGDSALLTLFHRYINFFVAMLTQSGACNRMHEVESRMARWLLMTRDRVDSDEFPLTQEFLAQMLGVQRPTVNLAASALQRAGFIEYRRGRIRVLDRAGLETAACDCYGHINRHLHELSGREWRRS